LLRQSSKLATVSRSFAQMEGANTPLGIMQQFIKDKGIKHEMTTTDTPQHNGVAERMNCTLVKQVRMMLIDAALSESYWEYALHYAALLHNISPLRSLDQATPEEAWSGNKPDIL
jgi:transposase InsO family protein